MDGKITKDGDLMILRAGKWKQQICPTSSLNCGDACPLFGEPYKETIVANVAVDNYTLDLCKGEWTFNSFQDEREGQEATKWDLQQRQGDNRSI